MAGTKKGGERAAATNKHRYGDDFYSRIGSKGGANGHTGGFAYGDNATKFGKIGGVLSRRSRTIKLGDKLHNDEINELIPLAIRALGTLRINGVIHVVDEHAQHVTVYEKAAANDWEYLFTDCGVGPAIEVAWVAVLGEELAKYKDKISASIASDEYKLTKDEWDRYRIIRNLAKAFEVATGNKVK